jgi:hypothetical protein
MREPYFDGEKVTWAYRNPWAKEIYLNGTDGASYHPSYTREEIPWGFVDDLSVTGKFKYHGDKSLHGKLTVYRFL